MIRTLGASVRELYRNPAVFIPALVAVAVSSALLLTFYEIVFDFVYDLFVLGGLPEGNILEMPFLLLATYYWQILGTVVLSFVGFCINVWAVFAISHYLSGKEKGKVVGGAMKKALGNAGRIVSVGLLAAVIGFVYAFVVLFLLWLGIVLPILGLVIIALMILVSLSLIYLFTKLYFLPVVMAIEDLNVKKALPKVWEWGARRFWELLALVVILTVLSNALLDIGEELSLYLDEDTMFVIVPALFAVLATTYVNTVIVRYYLKNRK